MRIVMVVSLCAFVAFFGLAAGAQDQAASSGLETLKGYSTVRPAPNFDFEAAKEAAAKGTRLKIFTYSIHATKDHNSYSGTMVGGSPFAKQKATTNVPTYIIPVIVVIGANTFDPTVADTTCMVAPNDVPLTVFDNSPLFISPAASWVMNGVNVGKGQYTDAFQRANFWADVGGTSYNVNLSPVTVLSPGVYNVPADDGNIISDAAFGNGGCGPNKNPQGVEGEIYINDFDTWVTGTLLPQYKQITPGTFPVILLHNVVMGVTQPPNIAECCVLGYHGATAGPPSGQTYSPMDFDTSGIFGTGVRDTSASAHEIGEWMNDPYGTNPTPVWSSGQSAACSSGGQNNLEVGDPLSGISNDWTVNGANGFSYHMQELTFFSWFYNADHVASLGSGGDFSNNGTFKGPSEPCPTGGTYPN
jgi:hypothetical protein